MARLVGLLFFSWELCALMSRIWLILNSLCLCWSVKLRRRWKELADQHSRMVKFRRSSWFYRVRKIMLSVRLFLRKVNYNIHFSSLSQLIMIVWLGILNLLLFSGAAVYSSELLLKGIVTQKLEYERLVCTFEKLTYLGKFEFLQSEWGNACDSYK